MLMHVDKNCSYQYTDKWTFISQIYSTCCYILTYFHYGVTNQNYHTNYKLHTNTNTHTHTHTFNSPFSGTTQVSRYQKGITKLDFTEARDSEWQWHQLGHMQVCTLLQTDNHTSTTPLCFLRPNALPVAQPTASKHWRQNKLITKEN